MNKKNEVRALWVESGAGGMLSKSLKEKDIRKLISNIKNLNFNTIFWLIKGRKSGHASVLYYPSKVGLSHEYAYNFDPTPLLISEARKAGISVHAYFSVFTEGDITRNKETILMKHPDWAVINRQGQTCLSFACASSLGYREYILNLIDEILTNYPFDGLHLDFIRYPRTPCFCKNCKINIKKRFGINLEPKFSLEFGEKLEEKTEEGELGARLDRIGSIIDYYCQNVHDTVVEIYKKVKKINPVISLSAAVFPNPRTAISQVFCDWLGFSNYLDFICPMLYYYSPKQFYLTISRIRKILNSSTKLVPGIAAIGRIHRLANQNKNYHNKPIDYEYIAELIKLNRKAGAEGFGIFQYESLMGFSPSLYTKEEWGTPIVGGKFDIKKQQLRDLFQ
jgi:uncharacterized lipoprotein YddW (UPF0748 family)